MTEREGYVQAPGGRVWYRIVGDGPGIPLLTLHGGPGAGHDYLESLAALGDERPVVFYDQLGCGRSDIPDDTSLWAVERFVREVDAVRGQLGLGRVHLLGQSWGGWLAIEYMAGGPAGIVSLTLASTSASVREFLDGVLPLVRALPAEARDVIDRCEAEGKTDAPEYQAAVFQFYQRHLCRLPAWPEGMVRSVANIAATPVYAHMWGPSEFTLTGTLAGWHREADLGRITAPTLITCGRFDEMTPVCAETLRRGIPGSQVRIFENSSHTAHIEECDAYLDCLRDFLSQAEPAGQASA